MKRVSFVCTTYRRYRCVERIIEQFLQQDYENIELLVFNTDIEHRMRFADYLFDDLGKKNLILINNAVDYVTGKYYTNRGAICRDAVGHATGDYFMLADDDDVYLPWHVRQAVDGIESNGKAAWKPKQSMFAVADRVELCQNTLEASVIVQMSKIREIGFRTDVTGYEGLSWYTKLRDDGQLNENEEVFVPSYCFNWSDPSEMAGHKQSGDINNPNNFKNHKLQSNDISDKPLDRFGELNIRAFYSKYYNFLNKNREKFLPEVWQKYALEYVQPE